jgi:hypothetical protein
MTSLMWTAIGGPSSSAMRRNSIPFCTCQRRQKLTTRTVSNGIRFEVVKRRRDIGVEFGLTISFGSAGKSLAFGGWVPSTIEVRRSAGAEGQLMFPSTQALGGWMLAAKAGDQTERTG